MTPIMSIASIVVGAASAIVLFPRLGLCEPSQRRHLAHRLADRFRRITGPDLARRNVMHEAAARRKLCAAADGEMIGYADPPSHHDAVTDGHRARYAGLPGNHAIAVDADVVG